MTGNKLPWRYCVVGNIKGEHYNDGSLRYGTAAYSGGIKVYLCGKLWNDSDKTISVIGLNRFKRYAVNDVPVDLIENVRCQRVYRPKLLEIMSDWEFDDCWWGTSDVDRDSTKVFLMKWNYKRDCANRSKGRET